MKGENPSILYPARLSFRIEGETKNFSDKQKLKENNDINYALKEIFKRSSVNRKEQETMGKRKT